MRILLSGAAIAALALGSMYAPGAAQSTMSGMSGGSMMPHCSAKAGPVVWFMASAKTYYLKGSSHWGKGMGRYVCRATAVARGGHAGMGMMGGSHGTMGGSHGTMGGSHAMPDASMAPAMTMAPRPMSSGNPMSGNQGNTGAPGAGGQIPNNPASSSNNNPSPSPHP